MATNRPSLVLIGIPEFARGLGLSRWTIDRWLREGVLPQPVNLQGRTRWREDVADRWIRERTAEPRRHFASARDQ